MWPNPQKTADLVTFNEKILNEKLHFLCSEMHFHILSRTDKSNRQSQRGEFDERETEIQRETHITTITIEPKPKSIIKKNVTSN